MPSAPGLRCGATTKRSGRACGQGAGKRTDHPGIGHCWLHGGTTPNGRKYAQRQATERALATLGVPFGEGDPFALLREAVRHAHGQLRAASALVLDAVDSIGDAKAPPTVPLREALEALDRAVRTAARTGKATVDADVAEREVTIAEETAAVVVAALRRALDAAGVTGDARVEAERALIEDLRTAQPVGDGLN